MAKTFKKTATQAATKGAEGVKNVAADALAAGAVTAAGVVISRVAEAVGSGSKKLEQSNPAIHSAIHQADPGHSKGVGRSDMRSVKKRTNKKRTKSARPAKSVKRKASARAKKSRRTSP